MAEYNPLFYNLPSRKCSLELGVHVTLNILLNMAVQLFMGYVRIFCILLNGQSKLKSMMMNGFVLKCQGSWKHQPVGTLPLHATFRTKRDFSTYSIGHTSFHISPYTLGTLLCLLGACPLGQKPVRQWFCTALDVLLDVRLLLLFSFFLAHCLRKIHPEMTNNWKI